MPDGRTDGRTDRQTDGIAVASTALAMRAVRRAVKMESRHSVEGPIGHEFSLIMVALCNRADHNIFIL